MTAMSMCQAVSAANRGVPGYAFKVGHHRQSGGTGWTIWLFGNHEGRECWLTERVAAGLFDRQTLCGVEVPRRAWQQAWLGAVGIGGSRESIVFLLTRPRTRALKVSLEGVGRVSGRKIIIPVRRLTAKQARAAHLRRAVGIAVARVGGTVTGLGKVSTVGP
jgi:hypothetical protein